ncbi:hypothetical protein GN156_11885 [bacterium LRH843]|nr:hypothetical protein [bacterium LRH843]
MKRTLRMGSLITVGVGATTIWLSNKSNRIKAKSFIRDLKRKIKPTVFEKCKQLPIEKGGHPDPYDDADNNMVDEGALYSVKFYNEKMQ